MNPFDLIQMIKQGRNPQQLVMTILSERANGNPLMSNLLSLAQQGNTAQIERIARNALQSQGKNFDVQFQKFKNSFGI